MPSDLRTTGRTIRDLSVLFLERKIMRMQLELRELHLCLSYYMHDKLWLPLQKHLTCKLSIWYTSLSPTDVGIYFVYRFRDASKRMYTGRTIRIYRKTSDSSISNSHYYRIVFTV